MVSFASREIRAVSESDTDSDNGDNVDMETDNGDDCLRLRRDRKPSPVL